ncbi:hypothetical protein [Sandaracinobacteroides hominis]|uniref:hypothetical protein n=1 Tax=Sandaracinobacteroides hominis TaxID=2780086 RepID=UPI0018F611D4|nr:hypothetical protein [Sandaracinobacteroides hominis]
MMMMPDVPAVVAPAPAADEDIIVAARRMAEVRVTLGRDSRGRGQCGIQVSSGDPFVDELACRDLSICLQPRKATPEQVNSCIEARKPGLVDQIAIYLQRQRNANVEN